MWCQGGQRDAVATVKRGDDGGQTRVLAVTQKVKATLYNPQEGRTVSLEVWSKREGGVEDNTQVTGLVCPVAE